MNNISHNDKIYGYGWILPGVLALFTQVWQHIVYPMQCPYDAGRIGIYDTQHTHTLVIRIISDTHRIRYVYRAAMGGLVK